MVFGLVSVLATEAGRPANVRGGGLSTMKSGASAFDAPAETARADLG